MKASARRKRAILRHRRQHRPPRPIVLPRHPVDDEGTWVIGPLTGWELFLIHRYGSLPTT